MRDLPIRGATVGDGLRHDPRRAGLPVARYAATVSKIVQHCTPAVDIAVAGTKNSQIRRHRGENPGAWTTLALQ